MTDNQKLDWATRVLQIATGSGNEEMAVKLALEILQYQDVPLVETIETPDYSVKWDEVYMAFDRNKVLAIETYRDRFLENRPGLRAAKEIIENSMHHSYPLTHTEAFELIQKYDQT